MIRKTIGHQRIRADLTGSGSTPRNSDCLLPDRPRIGDFENPGSRVEEFSQVREVNIRSHMVSAKLVDGIKWREIDLLGDPLPGGDFQSRLGLCSPERPDGLLVAAGEFECQPELPVRVVKLNIASSQVCDGDRRHHRFIRYVLQSLEFQVHLNLCLCRGGTKKYTQRGKNEA